MRKGYSEGIYNWNRDRVGQSVSIDKIEYAEKEYVVDLNTRVTVLEERESKIINQVANNAQNIKDAFDQIRFNYNALRDLSRRIAFLENAPSVAKKKRRVTICAGDQKVEVIKV